MGYIGLLLNAPYKIDSMVWMRCRSLSYILLFLCSFLFCWLYELEGILKKGGLKIEVTMVLGGTGVLGW
jgi:hypothetical protein